MISSGPKRQYVFGSPKRTSSPKYVGRAVGFVESARSNCGACSGIGWVPDRQNRCLVRCMCTDPNEVVETS